MSATEINNTGKSLSYQKCILEIMAKQDFSQKQYYIFFHTLQDLIGCKLFLFKELIN